MLCPFWAVRLSVNHSAQAADSQTGFPDKTSLRRKQGNSVMYHIALC